MDWLTSYVVLRFTEECRFCEVYETNDVRKAKYWLGFIGEEGDVLCRTPKHQKFTGDTMAPEYCCHKEGTGTGGIFADERRWRERCLRGTPDLLLPTHKVFPGTVTGQ